MGTIWGQAVQANISAVTAPVGPDPDPNRVSHYVGYPISAGARLSSQALGVALGVLSLVLLGSVW